MTVILHEPWSASSLIKLQLSTEYIQREPYFQNYLIW